jgi:diguanylate cyclase (GGDEF)-like protein/PAS domain S-box-containing protein
MNKIMQKWRNFEALMSNAIDGIYIINIDGRILEANDAFCNMMGYTQNEIKSMSISDWNVQYSKDELQDRLKDFAGKQARFETILRRKDGTLIDVEISTRSVSIDGEIYYFTSSRGITAQKREQHEMELMKVSIDHSGDAIHWVNSDAKIVYVNESFCHSLGYSKEDLLTMSIPDIDPDFPADDWPEHWKEFRRLGSMTFESRHRKKNGEIFPVEINLTHISFENEEYNCVYARDITERKKIEEELKLSSLILESSSEGMVVTDENNRIIAVNPAFTAITGYSFEEVKGKSPNILSSGRHDAAFYKAMWDEVKATGHWHGEIWDKRKDGSIHAKLLTINTIQKNGDGVYRYVALFSDITEKKLSEETIWKQANFDSLTGLPNREMFHDRLAQETKKADRSRLPVALLMIDLDQFKEVNDTLGHSVGDALLQQAADRIRSCVRETDTVARLGGDEFTVVLSEIDDDSRAEDIAQKIIKKLAEPYHLDVESLYVSASIGISLYPNDAADIDTLLKNADQAMYVAKNKGRNRFCYFAPKYQQDALARLRLVNDLRGALAAGQFRVYFQPIIELSSGHIHKAEALLRWQHPERGLVSPMEFIPAAEETGLIIEIGNWVFKESARWVKRWNDQLAENLKVSGNKSSAEYMDYQISVNVSPVQFKTDNLVFAEQWLQDLQEHGLSGKGIVVEITEGLLLNAEDDILKKLLKLRDAGVQVAIDDFGTGYSSLAYLKKFDIDYLKIDQSFVRHLETDSNDRTLTEAIIAMAHKLGLKVIAEGVETEGQRRFLSAAECDYAQGFLFSKPVTPEEFEKLIGC